MFSVAFDSRLQVTSHQEMFRGTVKGAVVHPREVVEEALAHNAAAVIFVRCHPSGNPDPSRGDKYITLKLRGAQALVNMRCWITS